METEALLRRIQDLSARCQKKDILTRSSFLTVEEQELLSLWARNHPPVPVFFGGREECERKMAFFLPSYLEEIPGDELLCLRLKGELSTLSHRDFLGAILHLGLERESIGDIWTGERESYVFCTPAAARLMENELIKVGGQHVQAEAVDADVAVPPKLQMEELSFSVASLRLDAVVSGLFRISRTKAAERIQRGDCQLNHRQSLKPDAPVKEGDILSIKGLGKGTVLSIGGKSKKGRLFLSCGRMK